MKANISMPIEHNHSGLFGRVTHDFSAALEWLAGPGMSEQERTARAMSEVQRHKYDASPLHLL
jgi:hypothetical protein